MEFVLIVAGVLVALGVDEWREVRREAELELEYAVRLKSDLQADTARFNRYESVGLQSKVQALRRLRARDPALLTVEDPNTAMETLRGSMHWGIPEAQRSVFDELGSTGNLRLLGNPDVKRILADYYARHDLAFAFAQDRIGRYPEVLAASFPGGLFYDWWVGGVDVSSADVETGLRSLATNPALDEALNAELHYTALLISLMEDIRERALALLEALDVAYPN